MGGWLLLEPGPSRPLFDQHPIGRGGELARCEWDLLTALLKARGKKYVSEVIKKHRETHTTKADFEAIRACGLNAVRLPIGYWVLLGAAEGEPYEGPAVEYVDRAVDWAEACGLQIVLDLHGCPGGESGEAPCGRRQRPDGTWKWRDWRFQESLKAIEFLASRYCKRRCVTGIAVCNEPSNEVPNHALSRYYEKAIGRIRAAGMPASRVAVVCPLFQRDEDEFMSYWSKLTGNKHKNVCFDVHCYHCFENFFNGLTFAKQLRYTTENAAMFRQYPMVVGEWSLSLGAASWATCGDMQEKDVYRRFAATQLESFKQASHGSFFWNWTERDDAIEWNFQQAWQLGFFSAPFRPFPAWSAGEDPLEEEIHPSPHDGNGIVWGDAVCLRTFYGRYVDVEGTKVNARWPDKGDWQTFTIHPASCMEAVLAEQKSRCRVRSGDVIRMRSHAGNFLTVTDGKIVASRRPASDSCEWVLHIDGAASLSHRSYVSLECRASCRNLKADHNVEGLFADFKECDGECNVFAIEKLPSTEQEACATKVSPVKKTPRKRRLVSEDQAPATPAKGFAAKKSPPKRRSASARKQHRYPAPSPLAKSRKLDSTGFMATPSKVMRMT